MTRHAERGADNRFTRSRVDTSAVPDVDWDTFLAEHFVWHQGEHVTMVGPTGSGKTNLALQIIGQRNYVVALATKPRDDTMEQLVKKDRWRKIQTWAKAPKVGALRELRLVLWPRYKSPHDMDAQAAELDYALTSMFIEGGWTVLADELYWLQDLGLRKHLRAWWSQGRSNKLTLVAGTQRPTHVDLMAYDQATHVFFWRDNDEANLKRISGMNGQNARLIREVVANLPRHATLYVNTRTGAMVTTTAPRK